MRGQLPGLYFDTKSEQILYLASGHSLYSLVSWTQRLAAWTQRLAAWTQPLVAWTQTLVDCTQTLVV